MLNPFAKRMDPHVLVLGMVGVKMGDRLILVGCHHGGRLGALAAKVGLSGRALAVVPDEASASRARKGAADAGVLVEVVVAPPTALGAEDAGFDVAVVDETGGAVTQSGAEGEAVARELARVVRPGGRVVFVVAGARGGVASLLGAGKPPVPAFATSAAASATLAAQGFTSIRTLAEREGLVFVEAIKPR
jgi:ubiquinone/menaquinone biosynthesis C-methylase UbiE